MKFIDLFAGLGGFHAALATLGHECVFASELDPELRALYEINFPDARGRVFGDIRHPAVKRQIPAHDILCAGFPCQPFSKSGGQQGLNDPTRRTLYPDLLEIQEDKIPEY